MNRIEWTRIVALGVLAVAGCTQDVSEGDENAQPIVGGVTASQYPEAALVDLYGKGQLYGYCSGAVIAPKVVLTAGHCVAGISSWKIKVPFANNQTATASEGATYDWTDSNSETVNPKQHDVGLLFLDTAIELSAPPEVAQAALANGTKVVNIGRIKSGKLSKTSLFVSSAIPVSSAAKVGYPYDYYSTEVIESGDSGGPTVTSGSSPHQIVAVNSGGGTGTQVLARVDLVYSWIDTQVKEHGGWATGSTGTGGSSGAGGSSGVGGVGTGGDSTGGSAGSGSGTTCAHAICETGARLSASCDACATKVCAADRYCCATAWDGQCKSEVASICGQSCGSSGGTACTHTICTTGASLKPSCDPCASQICGVDPYCCTHAWDGQCVSEVSLICSQQCK